MCLLLLHWPAVKISHVRTEGIPFSFELPETKGVHIAHSHISAVEDRSSAQILCGSVTSDHISDVPRRRGCAPFSAHPRSIHVLTKTTSWARQRGQKSFGNPTPLLSCFRKSGRMKAKPQNTHKLQYREVKEKEIKNVKKQKQVQSGVGLSSARQHTSGGQTLSPLVPKDVGFVVCAYFKMGNSRKQAFPRSKGVN